jgi:hypothetical protein
MGQFIAWPDQIVSEIYQFGGWTTVVPLSNRIVFAPAVANLWPSERNQPTHCLLLWWHPD